MKTLIIISIFCLAFTFNVSGQATPQEMLNKAIYEEEVNGNLEEAIKLFLEIVDNNSTNRTVTAEAFYHLGLANEKLGNKKAKEYYEKVVNNYGDKPETVQLAKQRLQYLTSQLPAKNLADTKIANKVIAQKIYSDPGFFGNISPDGKYLSTVDWQLGNMAIYNMETGEKRFVTNKGTWTPPTKFGDISVWSPDGKFLAYYWISGKIHQLWVQNLETGEDQLLAQASENKCPWPMEWTNDGKHLLAVTRDEFLNYSLQLVSVKDGSANIIKTLGDQCACGGASLSPDGKYIVVSTGNEIQKRDIHIFSVDGTLDNELISFPGADWAPKWTPDGQKIIFASNRSGSPSLWTVKVKDGQKMGEPKLIYEGISENYYSLRFTNDGRFIFLSSPAYSNVFQATLNYDQSIIEKPVPVTGERPGIYQAPFWSPDGSKMGYIVRRLESPKFGNNVIIRNLKTGEEKELKLRLRNLELPRGWAWPQWSTDSENLLLHYNPKENDVELVLVNIETEDKKYLKGNNWNLFGPENTILFVDSTGNKIIKQNISNGKEEVLFEMNKQIYHLTISNDKKILAFFVGEMGTGETQKELYCMPVNSSEPKILWKATEGQFFSWRAGLNFFPDGKTLLLSLSKMDMEKSVEKSRQFYTININTLEKKPLGKELTNSNDFFDNVRLSPDGTKIAFSRTRITNNLWSLEFDY